MGRKAAYTVKVADGQEVGFGLLVRAGDVYSVQFRDGDGGKFLLRSTGETARPRAITKAEQIIRDHYAPPETVTRTAGWDVVVAELRKHLEADGARVATVKDYIDTLNQIKKVAATPAAINTRLAQRWCNSYLTGTFSRQKGEGAKAYSRSPRTLHARVRKLKAIWSKYLVKRLRVAEANPWEAVDLPKLDQQPVRTLSSEQVNKFFEWLEKRWQGWELPSLFFEVKAVTGCRLGDLAALRTADLATVNGKHVATFAPTTTKARKSRVAVLPADLFKKLTALAGRTFLWESYASDIGQYLKLRGVPTHRINPEFDPERLVWWAKDEVDDFNKSRPEQPKIQSHDFRKRFVTEAHKAGTDVDTAAAAAGMSPATARGYYLALDQQTASEGVSAAIGETLRPKKPSA
ncbi:MAG: tyrosine-type recombinase/integrase [Planctomycetes bacterium]|nr:tyrosine-type recombinase/integrase [Planctomycetota bacterium]